MTRRSMPQGLGWPRFGRPRRLLVILLVIGLGFSVVAAMQGWSSGDVAAQADPTPTSIRLEFNTPTPRVVRTAVPADQGDADGDEIAFTADVWQGGYLRDDAVYYGRPWTAIYGAQSDYPRASLVIELSRDPEEAVDVTLEGLDDELPAKNRIALEINGQRVYEGDAWFANWDGIGDGADAAWTPVRITIPPGLLVAGVNRVTMLNLTPAANFSAPPYVLVSVGSVTSPEGGLFGPAEPDEIAVTVEVGS